MVHYNNRNREKMKRPQPVTSKPEKPKPQQEKSTSTFSSSTYSITHCLHSFAASTDPSSPAFEKTDLPGKGTGMVAARDLKAGDLVLQECPLFAIKDAEYLAQLGAIEDAYAKLSDQAKREYDSLYIAHPQRHFRKALAVFKTNAMQLGAGGRKAGIFLNGARFNHSCTPNCHRAWDEQNGVEWFIAMEDIKAGTELTISYAEVRVPKEQRQNTLQRHFGFVCTCKACSLGPEETLESDARRVEIKATDDSPNNLSKDDPLELVRRIKRSLALMEEEGLCGLKADLASECINLCTAYGDLENLNLWYDKALEYDRFESGIWSTKYHMITPWKGNLHLHPLLDTALNGSGRKVLEGPD
ncbi:hypothetical protein JCM16303_000660 [Sporobolomyces ruberrimus]